MPANWPRTGVFSRCPVHGVLLHSKVDMMKFLLVILLNHVLLSRVGLLLFNLLFNMTWRSTHDPVWLFCFRPPFLNSTFFFGNTQIFFSYTPRTVKIGFKKSLFLFLNRFFFWNGVKIYIIILIWCTRHLFLRCLKML